ncbi:MAG: response regulator transcription factor [Ignavibacteriaceae bacterium]|nr:response regulator transcription factor [Ignavibacteriaceae bacterium]
MKKIKVLFLSAESFLLMNPLNFFPDEPSIDFEVENYDNFKDINKYGKYDVFIFDDASLEEEEVLKISLSVSCLNNSKRILFTGRKERSYLINLVRSGIEGIVSKRAPVEKLKQAILNMSEDKKYYCDFIIRWVLTEDISFNLNKNEFKLFKLTDREKEILSLIAHGLKNKDISKKLFTSPRTIETHKRNMVKKLHFKSTVELTSFASKFC